MSKRGAVVMAVGGVPKAMWIGGTCVGVTERGDKERGQRWAGEWVAGQKNEKSGTTEKVRTLSCGNPSDPRGGRGEKREWSGGYSCASTRAMTIVMSSALPPASGIPALLAATANGETYDRSRDRLFASAFAAIAIWVSD